jgi:hypothetical protein
MQGGNFDNFKNFQDFFKDLGNDTYIFLPYVAFESFKKFQRKEYKYNDKLNIPWIFLFSIINHKEKYNKYTQELSEDDKDNLFGEFIEIIFYLDGATMSTILKNLDILYILDHLKIKEIEKFQPISEWTIKPNSYDERMKIINSGSSVTKPAYFDIKKSTNVSVSNSSNKIRIEYLLFKFNLISFPEFMNISALLLYLEKVNNTDNLYYEINDIIVSNFQILKTTGGTMDIKKDVMKEYPILFTKQYYVFDDVKNGRILINQQLKKMIKTILSDIILTKEMNYNSTYDTLISFDKEWIKLQTYMTVDPKSKEYPFKKNDLLSFERFIPPQLKRGFNYYANKTWSIYLPKYFGKVYGILLFLMGKLTLESVSNFQETAINTGLDWDTITITLGKDDILLQLNTGYYLQIDKNFNIDSGYDTFGYYVARQLEIFKNSKEWSDVDMKWKDINNMLGLVKQENSNRDTKIKEIESKLDDRKTLLSIDEERILKNKRELLEKVNINFQSNDIKDLKDDIQKLKQKETEFLTKTELGSQRDDIKKKVLESIASDFITKKDLDDKTIKVLKELPKKVEEDLKKIKSTELEKTPQEGLPTEIIEIKEMLEEVKKTKETHTELLKDKQDLVGKMNEISQKTGSLEELKKELNEVKSIRMDSTSLLLNREKELQKEQEEFNQLKSKIENQLETKNIRYLFELEYFTLFEMIKAVYPNDVWAYWINIVRNDNTDTRILEIVRSYAKSINFQSIDPKTIDTLKYICSLWLEYIFKINGTINPNYYEDLIDKIGSPEGYKRFGLYGFLKNK